MNDGLRDRIEGQIRERLIAESKDSENGVVRQLREQGLHERAEEISRMYSAVRTEHVEQGVARTLPFALEIAERNGVTDRLSDDQYDEAGIMAAKLNLQHTLQRFETRLQNAPNMRPERRQFAEAFLAMSKTHEAMMSETFADPKNITEGDLEHTAKIIAADLGKLTQQRLDRLQNPPPDEN